MRASGFCEIVLRIQYPVRPLNRFEREGSTHRFAETLPLWQVPLRLATAHEAQHSSQVGRPESSSGSLNPPWGLSGPSFSGGRIGCRNLVATGLSIYFTVALIIPRGALLERSPASAV